MNGMSTEEIEELTSEQCKSLWQCYLMGLFGSFGIIKGQYAMVCQLNQILHASIKQSNTKHRPKKPPEFNQVFPDVWELITGETEEDTLIRKTTPMNAAQAMMRMGIKPQEK